MMKQEAFDVDSFPDLSYPSRNAHENEVRYVDYSFFLWCTLSLTCVTLPMCTVSDSTGIHPYQNDGTGNIR